MLREVDEDEVSEGIVEELRRRVARRRREGATRREPLNLKPAMPWADQLRIFELMYPGGFRGEAWTREHRGTDAKRRLKRHRDPLLEDARELMTKQRLTAALSGAGVESLLDDYAAVLRRTSLCGKKYATRVGELRGDAAQAYAEALRETLFGSGSVASRFRHWLAVHESWFARPPSWKDATLPLAIAFPNDFICVHKRSFLLQAGELAPGRGYTRSASAQGYVAMRRLGREVVEKLVEAGHEPRDLMDVYDFIVTTLKPSSAKVLNG